MAEKIIAAIAVVLGGVFLGALLAIVYGLFFQILWNYVAPVYWPQAPHLTLLQAIATTMLLQTIIGPIKTAAKK